MDTVFVIGSNSFSGGDFVDLLLEHDRFDVIGISRSAEKSPLFLAYRARKDLSRFRFHRLDLNADAAELLALLDERRPRFVVNYASQSEVAPSWENPEQWFETNAVAVARLADHLRRQSWLERYVHVSTPEVYGSCEGHVREDAAFAPSTPYAASRAAGEMMLRVLHQSFDFPVVMTRAANVYGAHQQLFKIIPRTAIYAKAGRTLDLHGGGVQRRSFIHIRDVSRATLAAMENGEAGDVFNLATQEMIPIRRIVELVCERTGVEFDQVARVGADRVGQDSAYTLDCTRARERLGWEPLVDLDAGIAEVVAWVERCWDEIQREPLEYVHKA